MKSMKKPKLPKKPKMLNENTLKLGNSSSMSNKNLLQSVARSSLPSERWTPIKFANET
jgi:hypothetical protein